MKLRDYQIEACNAVYTTDIGQIISPTGTGKSVIQGSVFEKLIKNKPGFGVYLVLTPRIMLTNQLMESISKQLIKSKINLLALTVHSGSAALMAESDSSEYDQYVYASIRNKSTTNTSEIETELVEARHAKKPLLVCCTYDSIPALLRAMTMLSLEFDQVLCDEAHYIVEKKFNQNISNLKKIAKKIHFFTATQKVTVGTIGNGMNNDSFYGPVVFRRSPRQMIEQGYMIRPRIHFETSEKDAAWSQMVSDAFNEHQLQVKYNAKMLVCCDGSLTMEEISNSKQFIKYCKDNDITVFAISSVIGARINNIDVPNRTQFLKKLKSHSGREIVLHINILTEGIDIPDITGVMFIRNVGLTRFLQSIGRDTRVLTVDYGKETSNFQLNSSNWMKPYAWVIVAERDGDNEGKTSDIITIVDNLRLAGFEPHESVVIAVDRGKGTKEEFKFCNEPDDVAISNFSKLFIIQHKLELANIAGMNFADVLATSVKQ